MAMPKAMPSCVSLLVSRLIDFLIFPDDGMDNQIGPRHNT
jgi:hypothetical protein